MVSQAALYQRLRRERLKAEGNTCLFSCELSTKAAMSLIHLEKLRGQTGKTILENLILAEVERGR